MNNSGYVSIRVLKSETERNGLNCGIYGQNKGSKIRNIESQLLPINEPECLRSFRNLTMLSIFIFFRFSLPLISSTSCSYPTLVNVSSQSFTLDALFASLMWLFSRSHPWLYFCLLLYVLHGPFHILPWI